MGKLYGICLVVACALAAGCSSLNMGRIASAGGKALQAATLSDEAIGRYVAEYIAATDRQHTVCTGDDPYAARLERIAGKINNRDGIDIRVYRTGDVNAFACADGSIRVYSGLMDIMSDEEVLGVIGHEIGHIKKKHTKEAFRQALLTSALRDGIASAGGAAATLSDSQLGELGAALMSARYSQKHEYEADNYGYDFLKSHGINPWAMALSFEKLQSLQASGERPSGAIQQLFSTHPALEARTEAMIRRATADGFPRPETK